MFSLSPIKIMVIVAVVLLLLGPDKLPEVAQKLGSSWRALKRIQQRVEDEVREVIPDLPSSGDIVRLARSPVNLLNSLADRVDAREEASSVVETSEPFIEPEPLISTAPHRMSTPIVEHDQSAPPSNDPSLN